MSLGGFIEKPLSFDCYCTRGQSFAALLRIPTLSSSIRWLVEMAGVESGQEAKGVKGEQWTKRLPAWRRKTRRKVARRTAIVVHRWIGTRLTFQGYRTFDNCESFIPLKFQLDSNGLVALQHKENSLPRSDRVDSDKWWDNRITLARGSLMTRRVGSLERLDWF